MSYKELITNGIKRLRTEQKLNIEHNRYLPTAETIDKICEVFKIQPVELLLPEPQANLDKVRELINNKLCNCDLDKLIRINNMIDLM